MKTEIKKYAKYIPYAIIAVLIVIIFFMTKCQTGIETKYLDKIQNYTDQVKSYKDKAGELVAYNQVLELSNKEQLSIIAEQKKQLSDLLKDYKEVESATTVGTTIQIVHDTIRFTDTIPADFVQIYVQDTSKWFRLGAYIAPSFFMIDTLRFFNEESIVIGSKKMGFLKKPERRIEIKNSNPYATTTSISSYVINDKRKWYDTKAFAVAVGFVSGVVVGNRMGK